MTRTESQIQNGAFGRRFCLRVKGYAHPQY